MVATNFFARLYVFVVPVVFVAVAVSLSALARLCGRWSGKKPGGP